MVCQEPGEGLLSSHGEPTIALWTTSHRPLKTLWTALERSRRSSTTYRSTFCAQPPMVMVVALMPIEYLYGRDDPLRKPLCYSGSWRPRQSHKWLPVHLVVSRRFTSMVRRPQVSRRCRRNCRQKQRRRVRLVAEQHRPYRYQRQQVQTRCGPCHQGRHRSCAAGCRGR